MGSDRSDSLPSDFERNGFPFGSKSKGKLSLRSDPIQFERKSNTSFLIVVQDIVLGFACFGHLCIGEMMYCKLKHL